LVASGIGVSWSVAVLEVGVLCIARACLVQTEDMKFMSFLRTAWIHMREWRCTRICMYTHIHIF